MFYTRLKHRIQQLILTGVSDNMGGRMSTYNPVSFEGCIIATSSVKTEEAERPSTIDIYELYYENSTASIKLGSIIQDGNKTFKAISQPMRSPLGKLNRLWKIQLAEWRLP